MKFSNIDLSCLLFFLFRCRHTQLDNFAWMTPSYECSQLCGNRLRDSRSSPHYLNIRFDTSTPIFASHSYFASAKTMPLIVDVVVMSITLDTIAQENKLNKQIRMNYISFDYYYYYYYCRRFIFTISMNIIINSNIGTLCVYWNMHAEVVLAVTSSIREKILFVNIVVFVAALWCGRHCHV